MKTCIYLLLFVLTSNAFAQEAKISLLCNKWVQIGWKMSNDSLMRPIEIDCAKNHYVFYRDGKYSETIYCEKASGVWAFNSDSTKLEFAMSEYHGMKFPDQLRGYYPYLIVKLTSDSLIIGSEKYEIKGNSKVYKRDDEYLIREK